MNSPSNALAWEIWQRHRNRLLAIGAAILGFALIYPKLCALYGLRLDLPNALDAIPGEQISERLKQGHPLAGIAEILTVLFLLLGPLGCMLTSLLYVVWIFTFSEADARKGFGVAGRLFRLPISSGFLAGWLMTVGAVTVTIVYLGWTRLVQLPHVDIFDGYPNLLIWLTLLLLSQGIAWALDGFPILRVLFLSAVVFFLGFLGGPSVHGHPWIDQNSSTILLALLAAGGCSAFVGFGQIRHGGWQTWAWPRFFRWSLSSFRSSSLSPFKSIARAQFWFEWRRAGQKLVFTTCALSGAAVAIMSVVVARIGVLSEGDAAGLTIYLLLVPIFLHFVHGIIPERKVPPFLAVHPVTSGELVVAKLQSAAVSAALSWMISLILLVAVPLLGNAGQIDLFQFIAGIEHWPALLPVMILAAIFLTWRFTAVNLWCVSNRFWLSKWPVLAPYALLILCGLAMLYSGNPKFRQVISTVLPVLLGILVFVKFWLARRVFRVCLGRGWVSRSAIWKYCAVWAVLAMLFVAPTVMYFHRDNSVVSLVLGIVLLLPLARIGLAVVVLSQSRHA